MLAAERCAPGASQAEELVQPPRPPPAGISVISKFDTLRQPQLDKVLELECEAFPPCEQLGSVLLQQQAALRTGGLLIAEVGMHVVGFCLVSRSASSGLIAKICVGSAFQRRGVGSSLLARGIAELEQPTRCGVGVNEIMLHVDPERTGACNLYRAFGFERMALLPQYYTDGRAALLMRRLRPSPR